MGDGSTTASTAMTITIIIEGADFYYNTYKACIYPTMNEIILIKHLTCNTL